MRERDAVAEHQRVSEYGIKHINMPLTPERVWRAIQDAKANAA